MEYTNLRDLRVSRIGLGCMGMSHVYTGRNDDVASTQVLHRALDLGVTLFDTAELYGPFTNEELVGRVLGPYRDEVVIATKFGIGSRIGNPGPVDSSPENIRVSLEGSLKRLNVDYIDLYYQHRVDPNVPIEDVMGTLAEFVAQGKIRHIGLSEAGQQTIRRANAVHPVAALQSEYSLWTRDGDDGTLDTLRELGIGFVPYSPLSRGMLTGGITSMDQFDEDDWRRTNPRFEGGAFEHNRQLVREVTEIAAEVGCTPAQLALAWLLAKGPDWVPIPGTVNVSHLEEDLAAVSVILTAEQIARLDGVTQPVGEHHSPAQLKLFDR